MSHIWYHEPQKDESIKMAYGRASCLYCRSDLTFDRKAEIELQKGHGYHLIAAAVGYSGMYSSASVGICPVCGWWKYTHLMNMPSGNGFEDVFAGGCGVLKKLDPSNIEQPLAAVRSYLAAKYDARFEINPRIFEEVVASVFADVGYKTRVTAYSGDDGVDVIMDGPEEGLIGVQVKRYSGKINVDQIRALTGALLIGGYTRGVFVTTSSFQSGGERTAGLSAERGIPVELVDAERFYDALRIAQISSYSDSNVIPPWALLAEQALRSGP